MSAAATSHYAVADLAAIAPVACPCGWSRRAFLDVPEGLASLHRVDISVDAQTHFHKRLTEIYYVLECEPAAAMELDGERVPVHAGMSLYIPPYTRHRAVGKMKVLVVALPQFDPADEWATDDTPADNVASPLVGEG
jgi:mannose-6-phosphate isomerase-like protein (cupin superfamily)